MTDLRAFFRFFFFFLSMSIGILLCMISSLFGGDVLGRNMTIRKYWIRLAIWILGLEIDVEGKILDGVYLYTSNHRSFSDPVVALYFIKAFPLAKAEVSGYPLVGFGARLTGILFVQRNSMKSRANARNAIQQTLVRGQNVLIYPEGTTTIEARSQPFKVGSFEIAAALQTPVIPVAIEYRDPGDHWKDTSIWSHYRRQFGKRKCHCKISFGSPITNSDPIQLKQITRSWIDDRLILFREEFNNGGGSAIS